MTLLIAAAFVATLLMASIALAQGTTMGGGEMMMTTSGGMEQTMMATSGGMEETMMTTSSGMGATSDLPTSGGPAILLPAAALLLGSGILTYAVLRRR
jgi:hypothetical protein